MANAGSTRIRGLELETFARLTEMLSVDVTYAYTDAEYTSFNSINTEQVFGDPETRGRKAPRFPEHQGSVSVILTQALAGGWDGTFRFDQIYKGKRFTDEVNLAYAPSYWTSNLRATVDNGSLSFTLFFDNVFDEEYVLSGSRFRDLSQIPFANQFSFPYSISEGRKFGLTARYGF